MKGLSILAAFLSIKMLYLLYYNHFKHYTL